MHPYQMFRKIALLEALFQIAYCNTFWICDGHLPEIFSATVLFESGCEGKRHALHILTYSGIYLVYLSAGVMMGLVIFFAVDMMLLIKFPFN